MSVSASIVVHNTPRDQLEKALKCLLDSEVDTIYIMDNGNEPVTYQLPESHRIIYSKIANRGFGNGHNIAIGKRLENTSSENLDEEFHLVMNADVRWEGDVITKLKNYLLRHRDTALVMPKVFYPDGDLQYACRMLPTPADLFMKRFLPGRLAEKRMERYLLAVHDHDKELNVPYLLGSFMFFRLSDLKQCGGFDERFFMYPEDIDITRRLHKTRKTIYWPGASIIHDHGAASRKSIKMFRIHLYNMIRYFNKWGWWSDSERKEFNKRLMREIVYVPKWERPKGRG